MNQVIGQEFPLNFLVKKPTRFSDDCIGKTSFSSLGLLVIDGFMLSNFKCTDCIARYFDPKGATGLLSEKMLDLLWLIGQWIRARLNRKLGYCITCLPINDLYPIFGCWAG